MYVESVHVTHHRCLNMFSCPCSSDLLSYNSGLLSDDGSRPSSSMSTDEHALSGASSASRGLLPNHSSGAGSAGASSAMHPPGGGRVRTSSMPPKSTAPCQQWAQGYPPPGGGSTFPVAAISTPPYSVGPGPTPGQQSQQSIHSQEVSPSKTGSTPMVSSAVFFSFLFSSLQGFIMLLFSATVLCL